MWLVLTDRATCGASIGGDIVSGGLVLTDTVIYWAGLVVWVLDISWLVLADSVTYGAGGVWDKVG
jgi:hypothetical protein